MAIEVIRVADKFKIGKGMRMLNISRCDKCGKEYETPVGKQVPVRCECEEKQQGYSKP